VRHAGAPLPFTPPARGPHACVQPRDRRPFFFGASQKTVPTEFLKRALKGGDRFEPIDIAGHGKNALDFHIAFYLGECLTRSPGTRCVVLSKDKGFDPLLKHLAGRGFSVRRETTLGAAFPRTASTAAVSASRSSPERWEDTELQRLVDLEEAKRPRTRKRLVAHIYNHWKKEIAEADANQFVDRLIAAGKLSETGSAVTYHL
jgi:hypothetical protein